MPRFRKGIWFASVGFLIVLLSEKLYDYNLSFFNWTYLTSPIMNQQIFAFENTADCTGEIRAIRSAANKWNNVNAGFAFPQIQKGDDSLFHGINYEDGQNQIGWLQNWTFNRRWAAVAVAFLDSETNRILQVDTAFNDSYAWSSDETPAADKMDIVSCMVHEFGHWLFLNHSSAPAVMQPTLGPGDKRRNLKQDDIDGIKAIYNLQGWEYEQLTLEEGRSVESAVAVGRDNPATRAVAEENNIHVVWSDNSGGNAEIFYRKHKYGGNTNIDWGNIIQLSNNMGLSRCPSICTHKKFVHIVWIDNTPGKYDIFYARSVDGGTTWSSPVNLTNTVGDSYPPHLIADSKGCLHLVWTDNTPGLSTGNSDNFEVFYKRSTDFGLTWSDNIRLTFKPTDLPNILAYADHPKIASAPSGTSAPDTLYLVWRDNRLWATDTIEIFFKKSSDGGENWSEDKRITYTTGGAGCYEPDITVSESDGHIHLVWTGNMPAYSSAIFYNISLDGGETWLGDRRISSPDYNSHSPTIALGDISDNRYILHIAWISYVGGRDEIQYSKSMNRGGEWSSGATIKNGFNFCQSIQLGVSDHNIQIFWAANLPSSENYEIYHVRNRAIY